MYNKCCILFTIIKSCPCKSVHMYNKCCHLFAIMEFYPCISVPMYNKCCHVFTMMDPCPCKSVPMYYKCCHLFAHLSGRLMDELIVNQSLRLPSVVCLSTFSNIFYSETTGPIKLKFDMEIPLEAGTKVCSNGPGHMTKMAAMLIYGKKNL